MNNGEWDNLKTRLRNRRVGLSKANVEQLIAEVERLRALEAKRPESTQELDIANRWERWRSKAGEWRSNEQLAIAAEMDRLRNVGRIENLEKKVLDLEQIARHRIIR